MNKIWWVASFIIVGVLLGAGVLILVTRPPRGSPITLLPAPTLAPITVYVSGNVNQSGIYSLPPGSRINDAILAAGGFADNTNTSEINLAQILTDGEQINVPGLISPAATGIAGGQVDLVGSVVNINTASLALLDTLPNIGPKTAQDILDYRVANGPFDTIEEIMEVPGIGQGKFDAMKDLITIGMSP
jgi:competence protein ComEA